MAAEGFLLQIRELRQAHMRALVRYRRAEDALIAAEREAQDKPAEPSARTNYDQKRAAFRSTEDDLADAEQKLTEAIVKYNEALPRETPPAETKEPSR